MRTRDTDKELLVKEKAIDMIVSEGLESFTINKLAKACNISVATLYVYYEDKDDLILRIAIEEIKKLGEAVLGKFDPELSMEQGLKVQWKNRIKYITENTKSYLLIEQLRLSSYGPKTNNIIMADFRLVMGKFIDNAVSRGEMERLPLEVYWSIAFAPLYNLLNFHVQKRSLGGKPFALTEKVIWQTFDLVVKALKKER